MNDGMQFSFNFDALDVSGSEPLPGRNAMMEACSAQPFPSRDRSHLVLIVSQPTPLDGQRVLEPNSPEVTRMIRSAASVIGW